MAESRIGSSEGAGPDDGASRTSPGNWAARHDLLLYFILAYLLSWALWPLVILNPTSSPLVPFGPLIAAVVVSLLAGGTRELVTLLRQLTRWRVHPSGTSSHCLVPLSWRVLRRHLPLRRGRRCRGVVRTQIWVRLASPSCRR